MNTASHASALEPSDTKLAILRAARELIQTRSYVGLSFQELADRVGIRKASLYHHFPSKEALGIAVLERSIQQFDKWIARLSGTPEQHLTAYIAMFRDVLGAGHRMCPGGSMGPVWDSIEPALQQAARQVRQRQLDWLTVVIGQIKPSHIKVDATPAQLAIHMFAVCQGALLSARMSGRREDFEDAVTPLMAQLRLPPLP
jgi:TetR/AcrR family transcriptional repressor of nem operon